MVGRQRNELYATVVEERGGSYQERINRLLRKARKGHINVTAGGGFEDFDLLPNGRGCSLNVRDKGLSEGIVAVAALAASDAYRPSSREDADEADGDIFKLA